jgi:hypothetical protein
VPRQWRRIVSLSSEGVSIPLSVTEEYFMADVVHYRRFDMGDDSAVHANVHGDGPPKATEGTDKSS